MSNTKMLLESIQSNLKEEFIDSMTYVIKLSNGKEVLYKPSKSYSTSEWFKDFQNSHPEVKYINDIITTKEATKEDIARLQNNTNESNNTILDNTTDKLNETGEWDDNDEDMQMWLEDLRYQAKELAAEVKGEVKSVTGFDAYQGPRAIVHTPKHGDIEMWYDQEDDRGLTFNCKVAHVGWINGGINQLAEILNQDTIDDNEIISESEDTKPHKKADRQFIIALIKSGALDDIDTLEKEGGFEDAVDYWVNHYYDDYTDAELKDLDETAKSANDKLHEAQVKGLRTVKSQGNIYMLEDDNKQIIVGENYNSTEKLIENANIYFNKEEADKDYNHRLEIVKSLKEGWYYNDDYNERLKYLLADINSAGKTEEFAKLLKSEYQGDYEDYEDDDDEDDSDTIINLDGSTIHISDDDTDIWSEDEDPTSAMNDLLSKKNIADFLQSLDLVQDSNNMEDDEDDGATDYEDDDDDGFEEWVRRLFN